MNSNRLAATTSIGAVHLQVSDLQRSLSFYRDLLGFRVIRSEGLDAWLSATGEEPDLIRLTELAGAGRPPPRATGLFHVAYRAPGRAALGRWLHRLLDTKTTLQGASDHGVSEALYLADPDGLGVELYRDRPRDRWPFRGEYVAMVSEHLDTADLLAQGEGRRWDGADPASNIGHVHLCVSSLEGAESFYVDTLAGSTSCSATSRGPCSSLPGATTTTWAPTSGVPLTPRRRRRMSHGSSTTRWACRQHVTWPLCEHGLKRQGHRLRKTPGGLARGTTTG